MSASRARLTGSTLDSHEERLTAVIPVFLFFVALNHEGLAAEPHWDSRYLLLVFAVPAVVGLVVEAAAHRWIRHVGCRVARGVWP